MIVFRLKDMEMPNSCGGCELPLDLCDKWKTRNWGATRPPDCPLLEIPPHGRLIDADKPIRLVDTHGRAIEVAVAHIIENNGGAVDAVIPAEE